MKKLIYTGLMVVMAVCVTSCEKFLNVDPPSNLSGNNFWKTKADVDNYTNGIFELYRAATFRSNMKAGGGVDEFPFFAFSGDMRNAPIQVSGTGRGFADGRNYIDNLTVNNLRFLINPSYTWYDIFNFDRFTKWDRMFKVVASANILVEKVDEVEVMNERERAQFKAEGVFMRCMAYFTMVRVWGDVPYYTNAENITPVPRMKMTDVLKNCVEDLSAVQQDLPWTYDDPSRRAVRGMRGGALALLMHMEMWLASFEPANELQHYEDAIAFGEELLNENNGAYELLAFENFREIFRGRSREGLFEIPQNSNYGESFGWSFYSDHVSRYQKGGNTLTGSYIYYEKSFLDEIYPVGEPDRRRTTWFDGNIYATNGDFWLLKFSNIFVNENNSSVIDDSQIVFRLADVYLLLAEAYAKMGNTATAIERLNVIRFRAGAAGYAGTTDDELLETIYFERVRELMGEGHYFYDLVRTKYILDPDLSFGRAMSVENYRSGAWTWPLDPSVRNNNPNVTLNNYWQ